MHRHDQSQIKLNGVMVQTGLPFPLTHRDYHDYQLTRHVCLTCIFPYSAHHTFFFSINLSDILPIHLYSILSNLSFALSLVLAKKSL